MFRREGRVGHPELQGEGSDRVTHRMKAQRNWERPIFVAALIGILMLGGIGGMNALIGLFPK